MLIIFDLDDTLIETSKCLTPSRLQDALKKMMRAGLQVDSFEKALQLLLEINQTAPSSRKALETFSTVYSGGDESLQAALESFKEPLPADLSLSAADGAIELLEELAKEHTLALVTMGYYDVQLQKMKKAGIQPEIFSKIIVGSGPSKRPYYEQVLQELQHTQGIVCGDRVFLDLSPAKELKLRTVHIRAGRGLQQMQPACDVDFSIGKLQELKEIIAVVEV